MISKLLYKILPESLFIKTRNLYRTVYSSFYSPLDEETFRRILTGPLSIREGSVVFIHSSMDFLHLQFDTLRLLEILIETVGETGTLLFPSWHFTYRAEDYLRSGEVFDVRRSPSALGMLSEMARRYPGACRSLHPTNSIVAIGKHATYITGAHHQDIYPSGEWSPYFRTMQLGGIIAGIGVDAHFMSFVHCVEDVMKDDFPLKTRLDEVFTGKVRNFEGQIMEVKTLAAHPQIRKNDIRKFIRNHIPADVCHNFTIKGNRFFYADAAALFERMKELAGNNITIYQ